MLTGSQDVQSNECRIVDEKAMKVGKPANMREQSLALYCMP